MLIIGATAKLQKEIDREINNIQDYHQINALNKWIGNQFKVSRYKGVIFMNLETRYSVILFRLQRKQFNQIETIFKQQLQMNLIADGIKKSVVDQYLENFNDITFTKTFSRSILGSINENLYFSECLFAEEFGIQNPDMNDLNHYLNHDMIHLPLKGMLPSELMRRKLEEQYN